MSILTGSPMGVLEGYVYSLPTRYYMLTQISLYMLSMKIYVG